MNQARAILIRLYAALHSQSHNYRCGYCAAAVNPGLAFRWAGRSYCTQAHLTEDFALG